MNEVQGSPDLNDFLHELEVLIATHDNAACTVCNMIFSATAPDKQK